ncbi:MAG TPA: restriction system-associated AAA family ATPase [Bacteroidia bacterium]|nr:restriction system-associated AAA family ATPase [Bacteroidia bacterium]
MKLLSLEIGEQFRSLHAGFKVNFHQLTDKGVQSMMEFQPFCFAGLNGSGKSNVLEALAAIFYHLEMCVAKYRPDSFEKHFSRAKATPDAFTLKYLTCSGSKKDYVLYLADIVTITKEKGKEPEMTIEPHLLSKDWGAKPRKISSKPSDRSQERAAGKEYLPDLVVGYSSGENEILSLPFIKNRLIHFDEYKEAVKKGYPFDEPETSLLYIDEEMSQAVLLACMLYEDPETTLKPLRDELGIVGIRSFRMNLNMQTLYLDEEGKETSPILYQVEHIIEKLKGCATTWYEQKSGIKGMREGLFTVLTLDFFVDENTKQVFKDHFKSSFELFRFFQLLYELNANIINTSTKEEVYKSKGFYTDGKLPEAGPEDRVFYFLDYMILKDEGGEQPNERLLREFSDGEHQFLHTMGICLMLKDRRTLLLLDEPETHFNPKWRAEFIKILNSSIKAGGTNNFLKDVLLTSHSPFIISDCMPDNVLFFKKNEKNLLEAKRATELGLNTYGSSVDYILRNFFKTNLISSKSFDDLKNIIDNGTIDELRKAVDSFGESSQKQFLFKKIYEKMEKKDDN